MTPPQEMACWICTRIADDTTDVYVVIGAGQVCEPCAEELADDLQATAMARRIFHMTDDQLREAVNQL